MRSSVRVSESDDYSGYVEISHGLAINSAGSRVGLAGPGADAYIFQLAELTGDHLPTMTLTGHRPQANAIAISRDGAHIATADDAGIILWTARGERRINILSDGSAVLDVALSPDASRVVSAHADGSVAVWDVTGGRRLMAMEEAHVGGATKVAYSAEGTLFATGGVDGVVRLWDANSAQSVRALRGHHGTILSLAFGHTGILLASAAVDGNARIWDVSTGRQLMQVGGGDRQWGDAALGANDAALYVVSFSEAERHDVSSLARNIDELVAHTCDTFLPPHGRSFSAAEMVMDPLIGEILGARPGDLCDPFS
jgi:WD40 repeat protein